MVGEIGDIPPHLSGTERLLHGLIIYQQIPGKVQNHHTILHFPQGLPVDHLGGVREQGGMEGNHITFLVNLIPGVYFDNVTVQMPGSVNGDKGVTTIDGHTQPSGGVGYRTAHGSQTDDAQGLPCQLMAGKFGFALFYLLGNVILVFYGLHPVNAVHHIPAAQKHSAKAQLHNAVGVGPGGIEHYDALLCRLFQGDIVYPGASPGNGQQLMGKGHIVHSRTAHQNGLGFFCCGCLGVVLGQQIHSLGRDLIQTVNLIHRRSPLIRFSAQRIS